MSQTTVVAKDSVQGRSGKRDAVLEAATDAFLTYGYANTSMEQIAKCAGVAKQTVYNHFPSKEALFEEIVRRGCDDFLIPLSNVKLSPRPVRDVLMEIGTHIIESMVPERKIGLLRVILSETKHFEGLAEILFEAGPDKMNRFLSAYFKQAAAEKSLSIDYPEIAAQHFFAMITCHVEHLCLFNIQQDFSQARLQQWVSLGVDAFLRAYAPR